MCTRTLESGERCACCNALVVSCSTALLLYSCTLVSANLFLMPLAQQHALHFASPCTCPNGKVASTPLIQECNLQLFLKLAGIRALLSGEWRTLIALRERA